jgi:hypothetical protein
MSDMFATTSSWDATCRRASGRRHFNAVRRFRALLRLREVVGLLDKIGLARGCQSRVAEQLGVNRSTICRDMARLRRGSRPDTEAEKMDRAMAKLDRRARDEEKVDAEYDRQITASPPVVSVPAAHDEHPLPPAAPTTPVPKWLPAPRNSRASRIPRVSPGVRATGRTHRK